MDHGASRLPELTDIFEQATVKIANSKSAIVIIPAPANTSDESSEKSSIFRTTDE